MAMPLLAGIAITGAAGAVGGGILGSVFGSGIDGERSRIEEIVKSYQRDATQIKNKYENVTSISEVINREALYKKTGMGLDNTYLTNLSRAFVTPLDFNIYPNKEENGI